MSSAKRKAATDERPFKKAKTTKPGSSSKLATPSKIRKPADEKRNVAKSILLQEERAFPRGGGSVLTPLEHKQIRIEAERDALLEAEEGRNDDDLAKEMDADLFENASTSRTQQLKHKQKAKRNNGDMDEKRQKSGVKIQGLSYKNLAVGATVLGRVTAITSKDIALALPNNLTGYVPITAVSERLNGRLERMLAADDDDDNNTQEQDDDEIDFKSLFHTGQWLRAIVTGTVTEGADPSRTGKRHIELSIDPSVVNGQSPPESIVPNATLQASVRSVEDHGLVMDVAMSGVKGFVSKKDLGNVYKLDELSEGQVFLCVVTGKGSDGKVIKLSVDPARFSALVPRVDGKGATLLTEAPSVDLYLPGTAVNLLVTESGPGGVVGKIMGMLDATADVVHSGAANAADIEKSFKIGSKVKARILWSLPEADSRPRKVGVSLLQHMLVLPPPPSRLAEAASGKLRIQAAELEQSLPSSSIVEDVKVLHVLADRGMFLNMDSGDGKAEKLCFAHISQISDNRIESLSSTTGPYKLGSAHRARLMSYNPVDDICYVSLKQSILDQKYLRIDDVQVGEVVKGTVDRLLLGRSKSNSGITGVLVKLSDTITGLVPETHLSDVQLQHPEKKFREGFPVKARVLSVDVESRHIRLTLKKSIVNDHELFVWKSYAALEPGMESKGTIMKILENGAVVQFFGNVRAWLPVAEMSEAYVEDPKKYFRLGQVVDVRIVSVDAQTQQMKISCRSEDNTAPETQEAWTSVVGGQLVAGTVTQKTAESVIFDLDDGLQGVVRAMHLVDGSTAKAESALNRVRVGQRISELLVLHKHERNRQVVMTHKPGMLEDSKSATLLKSFRDVRQGQRVRGFVRNITSEGIYVEFVNGLVGLLPKSQVTAEMVTQTAFGLQKDQSVRPWILSLDELHQRFTLSLREQKDVPSSNTNATTFVSQEIDSVLQNPIDTSVTAITDLAIGKVTKARVASVKGTQLNVHLADHVQGRVDVSELFDAWDDIKSRKAPLQQFKQGDVLQAKVLGIHDSRNHRFLPISHRQGKVSVFELSAKASRVERDDRSLLSLDSVNTGQECLAFINNYGDNCVWVNLSPNVRGRIQLMDLSDDAGQLQNLERHFPIGCALRVKVKDVDISANRLDLTAKTSDAGALLALENVSLGMVLPARITKITDHAVNVQLSDSLAAPVPLIELDDDYSQVDPHKYNKNDIVRVCVLGVDLPNEKLYLTLRPSKVLSSGMAITDRQIARIDQLKEGDVVRGFVKRVSDKGIIVSLGAMVDAFVRISDLSDQYIKDWKSIYKVDELVSGRVLSLDTASNQLRLGLKKSQVDPNYKPPITIEDLANGMVVTGKVRKVEDFGAFVDIDNTLPRLSGLCHRSEVAAKRIDDVRKLYSAGDIVKAMVLSVDRQARKISLGLKASYFSNPDDARGDEHPDQNGDSDEEEEVEGIDEVPGVGTNGDTKDDASDLDDGRYVNSEEQSFESDMEIDSHNNAKPCLGLKPSGFDWTGEALEQPANDGASDSEDEASTSNKPKRRRTAFQEDRTGDLDKFGPQNVSDFERRLLAEPNNSDLWIEYMAFQLRLSEVQKARDIAERALRTIHIRDLDEKERIWIARLNLEVEYGDEEQVEEVFKQACQVQDALEIHERLASIYITAGKMDKANDIFERIVANKNFRSSPDIWFNYASFLMSTLNEPARARAMLPRAFKSIPVSEHRSLTSRFAALEFRSTNGDAERGRTIFEGLVTEWPNWSTGWDQWVELEKSRAVHAESEELKQEAIEKVRALYERLTGQKMKARRAKFIFGKWMEFERKFGNQKSQNKARDRAEEWTRKAREAKETKEGQD